MLERKTGPEPERIRQHAHALWEQEGRPEGRHDEHWARACRELQERDALIQATATDAENEIENISAEQPEETTAPLGDEVSDSDKVVQTARWTSVEIEPRTPKAGPGGHKPDPLRRKLRRLPLNTIMAGYEYALAAGGKR